MINAVNVPSNSERQLGGESSVEKSALDNEKTVSASAVSVHFHEALSTS